MQIFALSRNINSQNKRYWSSKYPHTVHEFLCMNLQVQSGVLRVHTKSCPSKRQILAGFNYKISHVITRT